MSNRMRVRIFRSENTKHSAEALQNGGIQEEEYALIYGGTVPAADPEEVLALFHQQHPPGFTGHALSVGDVMQICDGTQAGWYLCDQTGLQKIRFNPEKALHDNMLRILICEPGTEPYEAEIPDTLKGLQSVVGGRIEPIYFDPQNEAIIYCDEEFLFKVYMPNRIVGDCLVHGTFLIVGDGVNEEGELISVSLTDEQVSRYTEEFRYPLIKIVDLEEMDILGFLQM